MYSVSFPSLDPRNSEAIPLILASPHLSGPYRAHALRRSFIRVFRWGALWRTGAEQATEKVKSDKRYEGQRPQAVGDRQVGQAALPASSHGSRPPPSRGQDFAVLTVVPRFSSWFSCSSWLESLDSRLRGNDRVNIGVHLRFQHLCVPRLRGGRLSAIKTFFMVLL